MKNATRQPELYRRRREGLAYFRQWELSQDPVEMPLHKALEWNQALLELRERFGPVIEDSLEEKAERVGRLHRVLALLKH